MIFVAGVHGVGKTFLCSQLKEQINIPIYSASELIEQKRKIRYKENKKVYYLKKNQEYLLDVIKQKRRRYENFLLEGHFCLLNEQGEVEKIALNMLRQFEMTGIILLHASGMEIYRRIIRRDGIEHRIPYSKIEELQEQEMGYADYLAETLSLPLIKIDMDEGVDEAINQSLQFIAIVNGK